VDTATGGVQFAGKAR